MNRMWLAVLLLVGLVAGTTAGADKLRYKFETGKTYTYLVATETKINGQMMGQEFTLETKSDLSIAMTASAATAEGGWELVVRIVTGKVKVNFPMMGMRDTTVDLTEFMGKRMKVVISGRGKTLSVDPIDTIQPGRLSMMIGNPADMFRRLFSVLPDQPVDVKSTWKETMPDTSNNSGIKVIMKPNSDFSVAARESRNGMSTLKIPYTGKATMEGAGNQRGMDVTLDGSVKASGTLYFAPKEGLLVEAESGADVDQTITFTGAKSGAQTMLTNVKTSVKLQK
jgi:hypothetical protein